MPAGASGLKFSGRAADPVTVSTATVAGALDERILRAVDRLPPFSAVLGKLLATLANDDVSFGDLANLIEKDTVLAGNLLKVVNSAMYGRKGTVNSVRHAVALLGTGKVRNMVIGLSVCQLWSKVRMPRGWSSKNFNLHSIGVGVLSDLIALEVPVPYAEGAFVAGLLHDVGKLLIAIALPDEFEKVIALYEKGDRELVECELYVTGAPHPDCSGAVLDKWGLPMPIRRAAEFHHKPDEANGGQLHLAHVVQAANAYVNRTGLAVIPPVASHNGASPLSALEALGLSSEMATDMERTFQMDFEALKAFF